jgi:hypothetical protein
VFVAATQDEDLLLHAFGLQLDDSVASTTASTGKGSVAKDGAGKAAGVALAALSLAEDRLGAGGDRRGLGFGAAAAGPMPASTTTGARPSAAEPDPAGEQLWSANSAPAAAPPAQLSADIVAALLARLRLRRHLHQVRLYRCRWVG